MLRTIALTGAALAALVLPAAASSGAQRSWFVLQDAGGTACYVADRRAGPDEGQLSGPYPSEMAAVAVLDRIAACKAVNVDPGKDSTYQNRS